MTLTNLGSLAAFSTALGSRFWGQAIVIKYSNRLSGECGQSKYLVILGAIPQILFSQKKVLSELMF